MTTTTKTRTRAKALRTVDEDVGAKTLAHIHQRLLIDEAWTDRRELGFTWWAHRLAQHIDAGLPVDDDGVVLTRITSRIPVVTNVKAPAERVVTILAALNLLADCYCYVYDPQAQRIDSVQSGIVHAQTLDWRADLLASYFMIQLIHAEQDANYLARTLRGRAARSKHPAEGRRNEADDMLNVIDAVFMCSGVPQNPFTNAFEFESISELVNRINAVSLGASHDAVAIEVPFADATAMITLDARHPHPRLGPGLAIRLHLPNQIDFQQGADLAAWLNRKEAAGELLCHSLGAWSVRGDSDGDSSTVVHCAFVSAALWRSGLAMDAATGAILKLRQLNALLYPGVPSVDVRHVVADRLARAMRQETEMDDSGPEVESAGEIHTVGGVKFIDETKPGRFSAIEFDPNVVRSRKRRCDS